MKNGNRNYYAIRTVENLAKQTDGRIISSTTYSSEIQASDQLSNVLSSKGNFSSPTNQRFNHIVNTYKNGSNYVKSKNGQTWYSQNVTGPLGSTSGRSIPSDLAVNVQNAALSSLLDQTRSAIDLSVDLAQAGQVKGMVAGIFKLLLYVKKHPTKALKQFYSDFLRDPKKLGGKWLEFQYGWKPLAQTIYDCGVAVQQDAFQRLRVRGRASDQRIGKDVSRLAQNLVITRVWQDSVRAEYVCNFAIRTDVASALSNFTSLNPVSIAWELTPYSFVVDWAVDVGGYLRSAESACLMASAFKDGYSTLSMLTLVDHSESQNFEDSTVEIQLSSHGTYRGSDKNRSKLGAMPFPRPPQFKVDLGAARAANAIALLTQHMR